MSILSRLKVSRVLSLVVFVGTAMTSTLYAPTSYAVARSFSYTATKGFAVSVATVDPRTLPTGKVPPASKQKVVIPYHGVSGAKSQVKSGLPKTVGVPLHAGQTSLGFLQNFDGLKSLDNKNLTGFELEPPDQGLCVGNGFVGEVINMVGAFYRPNGTVVTGPFNLQNFFDEQPGITGTFVSDPRCYYDASTHTWFATILSIPQSRGSFRTQVDLAVNSSGDPTTPWTVYRIDTTDSTHPGCPCLADYPIFGIDQYNVYISTNEFPFFGSGFNGAQVYAIAKAPLIARHPSVRFVQFGDLTTGDYPAFHLQPAITNGKASAEYLMNSVPFDSIDNRLGLWAITNQQVVATGGIPTLTTTTLTSETYVTPSPAVNPNKNYLNPDDDGLQGLQYINGNLWAALDTALFVSGDSVSRNGGAWFEVHPSLSGSAVSGQISKQGYVSSSGNYLLYSAIATSTDGATVMVFTVTGANTLPSAAYAVLQPGASSFGAVQIAAPGATTDNGFTCNGVTGPCRWGDYSAAVIDPTSTNIWVGTEYIPVIGSQFANWGTRLFEVKA